ncbi:anhydro-N-acetylmuramic acid kinase [Dasania sp. GY-MA-18]|uniref:Anhydro-N-acetylmuramic acid kinase n=1 Tax=Dasania phycosphaerae TaxID=2950436 RepID=A0A9J6RRJ3_9GAMM|nr:MULTISPECIES: anhydro-N-acetylmuramic acid kinase [Dasania]MCR8924401.1 anhydro-N-acetylmuramic acid kinase [Dasania sp. GY-MA-18]MCZ0867076.1 anhydro-N-acetylmuramic acid kinase [Dasania phycosphaerae]MCZ0870528.1 anhydro-N-acetylmuramic acid kinase [Dasania phycosphaerae]
MAAPLQRYIGLMSGTSMDGIDAAILEVSPKGFKLGQHYSHNIPPALHQQLLALCAPGDNEIIRMGQADYLLGMEFATAVKKLLNISGLKPADITAIGSHGQTIRHHPQGPSPFSLQIGNPNLITQHTGICTVADFRSRDIAAGGQGAPLAPAFHQAAFASPDTNRVIVNIGGMANITPLIKGQATQGFDTGPGNVLLDYWIAKNIGERYDRNGDWAASGQVLTDLLSQMQQDPYFALPAPKSTGREYFNSYWLEQQLDQRSDKPADVQATLLQLTANTIAQAIQALGYPINEVYIGGGGAHNLALMQALKLALTPYSVHSTGALGIAPDWVEAAAFAWLAQQTLNSRSGNIPAATGANSACILGAIYPV